MFGLTVYYQRVKGKTKAIDKSAFVIMTSSENKHIFIWKNFSEWKPALEGMFPDVLTPELEAKVRANAAIVEYCDDPGPFEKLSGHTIDSMITLEKIDEFRRRYSHIRVFHACQTEDIKSYKKKGILLLSKDEQIERFRSIFLSGRFPELTKEMLQESIREVDSNKKHAEEELCLAIDERFIVEYCGHYLIYGSEYLGNLVSQLRTDSKPYRAELRKIGKPTFIEINLPNTSEYGTTYDERWALVWHMIMHWVYNIAHSRTESGAIDFTFSITKPLPPKHICRHFDPPIRIPDPTMRWKIYNTETGEYEDRV